MIFCVFLSFYLIGQNVSSKTPRIGENISYVTYSEEGYFDIENAGDGVIWDFAFFKLPYQKEITIEEKVSGRYSSLFPEADFILKEANDLEVYYKLSGNDILELGRTGGFWYLNHINKLILYSTNPIVRKSGLSYGQSYSDKSNFTLSLSIHEIPQYFDLQIPLVTDSVRYEVEIIREVTADGRGQLILPQSFYDVIRVKQEIEVVINTYAKGRMGWQELGTSLSFDDNGGALLQGTFHLETYEYWSEDHSFPVLVIEKLDDFSNNIKYLVTDSNIPMIKVHGKKKDVLAYPNPTYGEIEFQLVNLPTGDYELQIYNIVSKPIYADIFSVNQSRKIKTDLSFLSKGTYLYSIIDPQGNKIVTKRVMIITP